MHLVFQVFLVLHFSLKTDIWLKFLHCYWISCPHLPVGEEYFGNLNASACAFWPFSSINLVFQVSHHFWSKNCFAIILSRFKFTYRGTKSGWPDATDDYWLHTHNAYTNSYLAAYSWILTSTNSVSLFPMRHTYVCKAMCFSRVFGWFSQKYSRKVSQLLFFIIPLKYDHTWHVALVTNA